MEVAISELEEKYQNTVSRIDDVKWKIERIQQFKRSQCTPFLKLFETSEHLSNDCDQLSKNCTDINDSYLEKKTNLRNALRNFEVQMNTLKNNIDKL